MVVCCLVSLLSAQPAMGFCLTTNNHCKNVVFACQTDYLPAMVDYCLESSHWEVSDLESLWHDLWQHALHALLHLLCLTSHVTVLERALATPCHPEQGCLPLQPICMYMRHSQLVSHHKVKEQL